MANIQAVDLLLNLRDGAGRKKIALKFLVRHSKNLFIELGIMKTGKCYIRALH
jgi:hypothetical protein